MFIIYQFNQKSEIKWKKHLHQFYYFLKLFFLKRNDFLIFKLKFKNLY